MGSTYLELVNQVLRAINEVELTASSFPSARGVHARAKDAVLTAIRKINTQKFEWPFNSAGVTQTTTIGLQLYLYPDGTKTADMNSFYLQLDDTLPVGTTHLLAISKDEWYNKYRDTDYNSGVTGQGAPVYVFRTDNGGFGISPSPDKEYTIVYRTFLESDALDLYSDVCTIPTEYDYVILSGSLYHMYMFLDNDSRTMAAQQEFMGNINYMSTVLIPKDIDATSGVVNFGGSTGSSTNYWW